MNSLVKKVFQEGSNVFVVTEDTSLSNFKKHMLDTYGPKVTARLNKPKATAVTIASVVRDQLKMKRKHIKIHALIPNPKGDGYRDSVMNASDGRFKFVGIRESK